MLQLKNSIDFFRKLSTPIIAGIWSIIGILVLWDVGLGYKYSHMYKELEPASTKADVLRAFGTPAGIDRSKWARQPVTWDDHSPVKEIPVELDFYKTFFGSTYIIGFDKDSNVISNEKRSD